MSVDPLKTVADVQHFFTLAPMQMVSKVLDFALPYLESSEWGNKIKESIAYSYKTTLLYPVVFNMGFFTSNLFYLSNKIFTYVLVDHRLEIVTSLEGGVAKLFVPFIQLFEKIASWVKKPISLSSDNEYLCKFLYHFCYMMLGITELSKFSLALVQKLSVRAFSALFFGIFLGLGFQQLPKILGLYFVWYVAAYITLKILQVIYPEYTPEKESFVKLLKNYLGKEVSVS